MRKDKLLTFVSTLAHAPLSQHPEWPHPLTPTQWILPDFQISPQICFNTSKLWIVDPYKKREITLQMKSLTLHVCLAPQTYYTAYNILEQVFSCAKVPQDALPQPLDFYGEDENCSLSICHVSPIVFKSLLFSQQLWKPWNHLQDKILREPGLQGSA